jgi:hypothetical protein
MFALFSHDLYGATPTSTFGVENSLVLWISFYRGYLLVRWRLWCFWRNAGIAWILVLFILREESHLGRGRVPSGVETWAC